MMTLLAFSGFLLAMLAVCELGRRFGMARIARDPEGLAKGIGAAEGAVFGLARAVAGLHVLRRSVEIRGSPSPDHGRGQCNRHGVPARRPAFAGCAAGDEGLVPPVSRRSTRDLPECAGSGRDESEPRGRRRLAGRDLEARRRGCHQAGNADAGRHAAAAGAERDDRHHLDPRHGDPQSSPGWSSS